MSDPDTVDRLLEQGFALVRATEALETIKQIPVRPRGKAHRPRTAQQSSRRRG